MPDYQNGKIYKITGTTDEGDELIYIGSTTQKLCVRFASHKRDLKNKNFSSKQVVSCSNCLITLIELFPCNSKEELLARERYYFDLYDCVNKLKPKLLEGERKEYNKQWRIENADEIKEYNKQWRIENADEIKENQKQYRIENADEIKENQKQWYIDNANKKKEYNKQWRIENADKFKEINKEYQKQYYIDNANKKKEYNKQYYLRKKQELV
jgi:hypothetical protein